MFCSTMDKQNLEEFWCFLVREYFQDKKQNKIYKQTKLWFSPDSFILISDPV